MSALERVRKHDLKTVNELLQVAAAEDSGSPELAKVIELDQYREKSTAVNDQPKSAEVQRKPVKKSMPGNRFFAEDYRKIETARNDTRALEELFQDYEVFIRFKVSGYFLMGADTEDLMQEAMIGLYKAVRDYDASKASFKSFADLCIRRQLITAIKTASRFKHEPLNGSLSFANRPAGDGHDDEGELFLGDMLPGSGRLPEDIVVGNEGLWHLVRSISSRLSNYEYDVLRLFIEGESYERIGQALGTDFKSVDNALQRAKGKLQVAMKEKNFKSPLLSQATR